MHACREEDLCARCGNRQEVCAAQQVGLGATIQVLLPLLRPSRLSTVRVYRPVVGVEDRAQPSEALERRGDDDGDCGNRPADLRGERRVMDEPRFLFDFFLFSNTCIYICIGY